MSQEDQDITSKIERLEAFEERTGVRIEALYAYVDQFDHVTLNGEIHPREGLSLKQTVELVLDVYDHHGRLLNTSSKVFLQDSFYGFQSFSLVACYVGKEAVRLRLYPR